jgi:hypothetical protein
MDEKRWGKLMREGIRKDPQLKRLDSSNITVGQLFEGVNKFFEDYRNPSSLGSYGFPYHPRGSHREHRH